MILTSEQCAKQPVAGQNTQQKEKKEIWNDFDTKKER